MSTAVMTLGSLQQLQSSKKMVMMLSPPHDLQTQIVQPSNGACVIVSANNYPASPPHFTNLDVPCAANNNNAKAKNNNNNNKVSRVGGGAVQKAIAVSRTSVVVAPPTTAASTAAAEALRCKRRIQFSQGDRVTFSGHQTASVARRNARERNRVKQVNNGFATLRSHIPPAIAAALQEESPPPPPVERSSGRSSAKDKEAAKKLSKVETLRMAVEYIRRLQCLLIETNNENNAPGTQGTPVNVKTESVIMPDSPAANNGFDADYEAALALSHYSMAPESSSVGMHGVTTTITTSSSNNNAFHPHPHPHFVTMSPPCSDAGSAGSPTPSYVSDGSVGASSTGYAPTTTFVPTSASGPHGGHTTHLGHSPSTPPDINMYEPMSPEDEELLDVISWWQQSN